MPPSGLAILIGAGPNTGTGITRILAHPSHGNLALALLARTPRNPLHLRHQPLLHRPRLHNRDIPIRHIAHLPRKSLRRHPRPQVLLRVEAQSRKHSSKKPLMNETHAEFVGSLETYVGGAMAFAQESLKLLFEHHGGATLGENGGEKKGTIIFTGTLGAMRSNVGFAAYGAGRAGVRQLAQSLGKEFSEKGVQVCHVIANGGIVDDVEREDMKVGKKIRAESVGKTYLWLIEQTPDFWTSELDIRPAMEKC